MFSGVWRAAPRKARSGMAESTIRTYEYLLDAYSRDCSAASLDPEALDPDVIAGWLCARCNVEMEGVATGPFAGAVTGRGLPIQGTWQAGRARAALSALSFKARERGICPEPGDDPFLLGILTSIRAALPRIRHRGRDGLEVEDIRLMRDSLDRLDRRAGRLLLLGVLRDLGHTNLQVASATGHSLLLALDDVPAVLRPLVATLVDEQAGRLDEPLFGRRPSGLTEEGARLACRSAVTEGFSTLAGHGPDVVLEIAMAMGRSERLRDGALLTTGFWAAARPGALGRLFWRDLVIDGIARIAVTMCEDKTGTRRAVLHARPDDSRACPVEALLLWLAEAGRLHGLKGATLPEVKSVLADQPVFPRTVTGGAGWLPMSGQRVNRVIADTATMAGLVGNFGGHSLRVGLITHLFLSGYSASEVAAVSGHKDVAQLHRYFRVRAERLANRLDAIRGEIDGY